MIFRDREGNEITSGSSQEGFIEKMYRTGFRRKAFTPLLLKPVSDISGKLLDSGISKPLIGPFVKSNNIDVKEYEEIEYKNFNQFFCRKIKPGRRPIDKDPTHLISPCDGKVSVFDIEKDSTFIIKGKEYTLKSLLRSEKLSDMFYGGTMIVVRLSVDDYHRYIYVENGRKTRNVRIQGRYHTVNPKAIEKVKVFEENTREFCMIKTENFGYMIQMEVGAMLVGRIVNEHEIASVKRGMEKGHFEYGGSTVIMIFQKNKVQIDPDIVKNSKEDIETIVKMGEKIGCK